MDEVISKEKKRWRSSRQPCLFAIFSPTVLASLVILFDSLSRSMKPRQMVDGRERATLCRGYPGCPQRRRNRYAVKNFPSIFSPPFRFLNDLPFSVPLQQLEWYKFGGVRCARWTAESRNTIHDTIVILRTARNTGRRVCFIRCLLNFTTGHYALDSGKTRGNNNNARFNRLHVPDTSAMPRFRFPYDRSHAKNGPIFRKEIRFRAPNSTSPLLSSSRLLCFDETTKRYRNSIVVVFPAITLRWLVNER